LGAGSLAPQSATEAPAAPPRRRLARAVVQASLPLGILADDLFHEWGPSGVALPIWVAVLAITVVSLAWTAGRTVTREACCWLAAAVLFAAGAAWRDSEALRAFDFMVTVGALGMAAVALNDVRAAVFARRFRDTVWATAAMLRDVIAGFFPLVLRDAFPPDGRERARPLGRRIVRGAVIAIPLLLVFGSLLVSADPIFASLLPALDFETIVSHTLLIGFFTWIVAGWARRALLDRPQAVAPDGFPVTLDQHDVTMALGTVLGLFVVFMGAQLGWLFGGESFLRARTGLTVAAYARTGFFQLVWVVLLVIPLLLATRAALRDEDGAVRRHTLLAVPIIALVGTIELSAALRLRLYVQYYGLTTDRLFAVVFMAWLGLVLVWLAVTVLRGKARPFVAGSALSGLMTLAGLNLANPDAIVARVNIARSATAPRVTEARSGVTGNEPSMDLLYLATLSGDATALAVDAVLAPPRSPEGSALRTADEGTRCAAARLLLAQWGPASRRAKYYDAPGSWRRANAGERAGLHAVSSHVGALYSVDRAACAETRARENAERAAFEARTRATQTPPGVPPQR
jgi:hypothetical protein